MQDMQEYVVWRIISQFSGTLGRRNKLAKIQAEELKNTLNKNENLEQELKDVKRELEKIKLEQTQDNSQNILNRGTINAKDEFKVDANDLELVDRFAFKPKVSFRQNRRPRRGLIFHVVRVLRKF